MQIEIRRSAYKDLDKIPQHSRAAIEAVIIAIIEARVIADIRNIKKLKGHSTAYRIRVGDYRIGILFEDNTVNIMRILPRKDIYKLFP